MQLVSFLQLLGTPYSSFFVASSALIIKLYILGSTLPQGKRLPFSAMYNPWLFFITIVGCSAFIDLSTVIKMLSITYLPALDYRFVLLVLRLAWAMYVLQRLLTVLFLKYMTNKDYSLTFLDKLLIVVSALIALYFIILAFTDFSILNVQQGYESLLSDPLEAKIMRYNVYFFDLLTIIYVYLVMCSPFYATLPTFLRRHVRTFVLAFILPYAISTTLATFETFSNLEVLMGQALDQSPYTIEVFSTLIATAALIYCARRLMSFLGMSLLVPREPSERRPL